MSYGEQQDANGTVECGYCTCMTGLTKTCSHVATILYWLETAIRISDDVSCTSKPNKWLSPMPDLAKYTRSPTPLPQTNFTPVIATTLKHIFAYYLESKAGYHVELCRLVLVHDHHL